MNVLIVHNHYRTSQPSGENVSVADEVELLRSAGCPIHSVNVDSDDIASWSRLRKAKLPANVIWSRSGSELVRAAIECHAPDVVHFHNTFPLLSPAAIRASHRLGVRTVVTLRNFRPFCAAGVLLRDRRPCEDCLTGRLGPVPSVLHGCYRGSRLRTVPVATMVGAHRALGTWTRFADAILFPSEWARAKYASLGWPSEKLHVKPNVVRAAGIRRRGAGSGFVCVSRLSEEKGIDVLIDAWRKAFPVGGASLTIVGSGEMDEALRLRAQDLPGVKFMGALPREELFETISGARALVMPSICGEFFGRAVVEAFATAVPVIVTRAGALPELVDDDETGLVVAPSSADELAAALTRLHESASFAAELGENARRAYTSRFSPQRLTQQLIDLYECVSGADPNMARGMMMASA